MEQIDSNDGKVLQEALVGAKKAGQREVALQISQAIREAMGTSFGTPFTSDAERIALRICAHYESQGR